MNMFWILLIVGVLALFTIRNLYRIRFPHDIERDSYGHLRYIKDISDNGHQLPENPTQTATTGSYQYPYFMHWLLSFVPTQWLESLDRYFSGLMDVILFSLLAILAPLGFLTLNEVLFTLILFISTPEFMRPDLPHGQGLTARKINVVVTSASLLVFLMWLQTDSTILLPLSIALGITVFLSGKFGVQAFLFITITIGVFTSPTALGLFFTAAFLAVIVSRGRYIKMVSSHVMHLYDYAMYKQFTIPYTQPTIKVLPGIKNIKSFQDLLEVAYRSYVINPLINNPFVIGVIFTIIFGLFTNQSLDILPGTKAWILGGVGSFILTSLPYLRFLGEPERYLEYAFLPSAILLARAWSVFGHYFQFVVVTLIIIGLLIIPIYQYVYSNILRNDQRSRSFEEILSYIDDLSTGTVLNQPMWKGRAIAWHTKHSVVDEMLNSNSSAISKEEMRNLHPKKYGVITADVNWLNEQFNPDWVVFDKTKKDDWENMGLEPPNTNPIYENSCYTIYDFESYFLSHDHDNH